MFRKTVYILIVLAAAGGGAFLLAGRGRDDRQRWQQRRKLRLLKEQLEDLRDHLRAYKEAHGRYPTTDEGLAALDNYDARIALRFARQPGGPDDKYAEFQRRSGSFWDTARATTKIFRAKKGRPPRSQADLRQMGLIRRFTPAGEGEADAAQVELAVTRGNSLLLLSPAGVLSPALLPYVYENRAGQDASAFAGSPAARDGERRYCVRVAPDVSLWSVAGEHAARRLDELRRQDLAVRGAGAGLIALAVVFAVLLVRAKLRIAGVAALLSAGAAGWAVHALMRPSCYLMGPAFSAPNRAMVARRKQLLDGCRAAGVIGDDAYAKSLAVLQGEGERPATRPAE